jgi:hypothetical protein
MRFNFNIKIIYLVRQLNLVDPPIWGKKVITVQFCVREPEKVNADIVQNLTSHFIRT